MSDDYDFRENINREHHLESLARRILGVHQQADCTEIRRKFWLLALEHHPDRNRDDEDCERRFQNMSNAYNYLCKDRDPKRYRFGDDGMKQQQSPEKYHTDSHWGYFLWWKEHFF